METCKLILHPEKSKIVNLREFSITKYPKNLDFLGFMMCPRAQTTKSTGKVKAIPSICESQKMKTNILKKSQGNGFTQMQKIVGRT
jgi:ABC-type uncharacterized transport system YnjBCD substrate-binding protein